MHVPCQLLIQYKITINELKNETTDFSEQMKTPGSLATRDGAGEAITEITAIEAMIVRNLNVISN